MPEFSACTCKTFLCLAHIDPASAIGVLVRSVVGPLVRWSRFDLGLSNVGEDGFYGPLA